MENWPGARVHLIPGADHFFSAAADSLLDAIPQAVSEPRRSGSTPWP
ncbi:MAG: hypothetical protein OXE83_05960 [Gammaproteobacteria bacterium]|nr:hypothetical protein [Gammaproteobacteria bacterium]